MAHTIAYTRFAFAFRFRGGVESLPSKTDATTSLEYGAGGKFVVVVFVVEKFVCKQVLFEDATQLAC